MIKGRKAGRLTSTYVNSDNRAFDTLEHCRHRARDKQGWDEVVTGIGEGREAKVHGGVKERVGCEEKRMIAENIDRIRLPSIGVGGGS